MTQIINLGTTWRLGKDHGHRQLQSETQFFSFPVMCYESLPHNRVRVMLWVFAGSLVKRRTGICRRCKGPDALVCLATNSH